VTAETRDGQAAQRKKNGHAGGCVLGYGWLVERMAGGGWSGATVKRRPGRRGTVGQWTLGLEHGGPDAVCTDLRDLDFHAVK